MSAKTVSVSLESDNLLWLQSRARTASHRSVSEVLNELVAKARETAAAGQTPKGNVESVVGFAQISEEDPSLRGADAAIRTLFEKSYDRYPAS